MQAVGDKSATIHRATDVGKTWKDGRSEGRIEYVEKKEGGH